MTHELFPAQFLSITKEYHVARNRTTSSIIYKFIVISVLTFILLLPFLFVDVSVRCKGILKAALELTNLKASSSGVIEQVLIRDNQRVRKGQLLIKIRSPVLEEREVYLREKINEITMLVQDVEQLINFTRLDHELNNWAPSTAFYKQSVSDFVQKVNEGTQRLKKVKKDYNRKKKLFDGEVIAASEFEDIRFELDKSNTALNLLKQAQLTNWQQDLQNYLKELADTRNRLNEVCSEKELLNVKAPLRGTIQNLAGVYPGNQVISGQELVQISPDTSLVAEVYVTPADIGLLRSGMDARMQVSAFNYNQWGLLHGKVDQISDDIYAADDHAFFKVRCVLAQHFLTLKNGYPGRLKKGMSVQVRFIVAQRSLWQLLYDKVDDWINPNTL